MTVVAFDLNGTLLDPSALAQPIGGRDEDHALVARAFDRTVQQAMAATLAGLFPPFPGLLKAALERELVMEGRSTAPLEQVVKQASALPPFPEAAAALRHLSTAGLRLAVVSNSARAYAERNLEQAGLRGWMSAVVGADEVRAYKPDGRVYGRLLEVVGEDAGDVWLVAAHWWDVLGARAAGLRTAWVARKERHLLASVGVPDAVGEDLLAVARQIAPG